jgi:class 3 adenylate cyclase
MISTETSLSKENLITILMALGNYTDGETFKALTDYFFHPDQEISIQAIRSSAHKNNSAAVPHLLHLIEKGSEAIKFEALSALSAMHAPLALDQLLNYFNHFDDVSLKSEILRTMNSLFPFEEKVLDLNRGVLTNNTDDEEMCKIAVHGLIDSADFPYLEYYLLHAPDSIQYEAFKKLYGSRSRKVAGFLKKFETEALKFSDDTKGAYIGAYYLRNINPNASFSQKLLKDATKQVHITYLKAIDEYIHRSVSPKSIFRFLLLLPFVDTEVEILISELIKKILELYQERTPGTQSEFRSITSVHLDQVFRKVSESHISVRKVRKKEDFLPTLFAHIIEKYCSAHLVDEVQRFFKETDRRNPPLLIEAMREALLEAEQSDIKGFKACIPLFLETDAKARLRIHHFLRKIDPQVANLLRRLNRLIKAAGYLQIKKLSKNIQDIRSFAAMEKICYLQEAATITLSQLDVHEVSKEAKGVFAHPAKNGDLLKCYVRSARYLPAREVAEPLINFLTGVGCAPDLRDLALESLSFMNLKMVPTAVGKLISSLVRSDIDRVHKDKIADVVAPCVDNVTIGWVIDLVSSSGTYTKTAGLRIMQQLGENRLDLPLEVMTGKLYSLIEDNERDVRLEALMSLVNLGDDYAEKIVQDWLESDDEDLVREVIVRIKEKITNSMINPLVKLLVHGSAGIQKTLREELSQLHQGRKGAKIRKALLDALQSSPERGEKDNKKREDARIAGVDTFLHPKLEYKLRREHTQVLTVFFIDMVGYTERSARSDMTNLVKLIKLFEENVIPSLERFRGQIVKKLGDGILAVFKHPASAAIAALEVQHKIKEYNRYAVDREKFQVRIGLDTGTVVWKDNDVFGDAVNTASRMETSAKPGETLITENVCSQINDFVTCESRGDITVKGKDNDIKVYTPVEVTHEVKAFLEIKKANLESVVGDRDSASLDRLKEVFFSPQFHIPPGITRGVKEAMQLLNTMHTLFTDMAQAASEITHDYHEEYLFKQYLQDKWDATITDLKNL